MNKLLIGIDLSKNSTGIVFRYNGISRYLNILNKLVFTHSKDKIKKSQIADLAISKNEVLQSLINLNNIHIILFESDPISPPSHIGINKWEQDHIKSCVLHSKLVFTEIMNIINQYYKHIEINDITICFENYSYGSKNSGDQTIQLIELTAFLKYNICTSFFNYNNLQNFLIVASPSIKMYVGSGNFDKYDLFNAYINNYKNDDLLINDPLWQVLRKNNGIYWKKKEKKLKKPKKIGNKKIGYKYINNLEIRTVHTPISDLLDAYFIALWLDDVYYKKNLTGL